MTTPPPPDQPTRAQHAPRQPDAPAAETAFATAAGAAEPPDATRPQFASGSPGEPKRYVPQSLHERYEIGDPIGSGGEASVWRAVERQYPRREVALKVYGPEDPQRPFDLALRERLANPAFRPYVPHLYAYDIAEDVPGVRIPWEAMEYFPLGSLVDLVEREKDRDGKLNPNRVRQIVARLVDALAFWENQIQQRQTDLSPSNVLIRDLKGPQLVLGDFGGVRGTDREFTTIHVKARYMPPEAFIPYNDARSPYWSLGRMVVEFLTGVRSELPEAVQRKELLRADPDVSSIQDKRWQDLAAGLLTYDYEYRWGEQEVRAWLDGKNPPVRRMAQSPTARPKITVRLGASPRTFDDPELLAKALVERPEDAALWVGSREGAARLRTWLEELGERRFDTYLLDGRGGGTVEAHRTVAALGAAFRPGDPPRYRGRIVTADELLRLSRDASQHSFVAEVVESGVLAYSAQHGCRHRVCHRRGGGVCHLLDTLAVQANDIMTACRPQLEGVREEAKREHAGAQRGRARSARDHALALLPENLSAPGPARDRLTAYAAAMVIDPREARAWRRSVRWTVRPFEAWWRRRRRAALRADPSTPEGVAAVLAAATLVTYVRNYARALTRERVGKPLKDRASKTWTRLRRLAAEPFVRAGSRRFHWLLLATLSTVEFERLASFTWWPTNTDIRRGVVRAWWDVMAAAHPQLEVLDGLNDPLGAWAEALAVRTMPWLPWAAVTVVLVTCLAVVRRARSNAWLARIAAAAVGWVVMAAYATHLVVERLWPPVYAVFFAGPAIVAGTLIVAPIIYGRITKRERLDLWPPPSSSLAAGRRPGRFARMVLLLLLVGGSLYGVQLVPLPAN